MFTRHCPNCDAVVEFAQCDYRICDNCGWRGDWTALIDSDTDEIVVLPFNETLAKAIIDMENIGFSEGLGPDSEEGQKEWNKLVRFVVAKYNLQNLLYNTKLREQC